MNVRECFVWWPRRATASADRLYTYRARVVKYYRARCSLTPRGVSLKSGPDRTDGPELSKILTSLGCAT